MTFFNVTITMQQAIIMFAVYVFGATVAFIYAGFNKQKIDSLFVTGLVFWPVVIVVAVLSFVLVTMPYRFGGWLGDRFGK